MRLEKAIFLDRDNTLNFDSGYTHRIADWRFLPGVPDALAKFVNAGWKLIVISNQSGIGRGYYDEAELKQLENYVSALLKPQAPITAWYHCPHLPEANCTCRKPKPGMLVSAAKDWNIDLGRSWMLGDQLSDAEAGLAAGCSAGLINPSPALPSPAASIRIWPSLLAAANAITESS